MFLFSLEEATTRSGDVKLLTLNEFDIALDMPQPPMLTDKSTKSEKIEHERWMRANKIALSILESGMTDTVRGGIKKQVLATDYLKAIENKFKESEKAEISQYMSMLTTYKIEGSVSIRDHIMKMTDAAEKLNSMDVNIGDKQLVFMILQALPAKYSQLKVSYNTQDKTWTVDELIAQCVQEETRQKQEKGKEAEAVNFVQARNKETIIASGKASKSFGKSAKNTKASKSNNLSVKIKDVSKIKCHHCKLKGHYRKDCEQFKDWLRSKGRTDVYVCVESNLIEVPEDSWWFDTGSSVHITNTLHGFQKQKQPSKGSYNVFVGEGTKVNIEAIGVVRLKLKSGFILKLNDVLYVPAMRRNLLSASKLVKQGLAFLVDDDSVKIFRKNRLHSLLGSAYMHDELWKLECIVDHTSLHVMNVNTKRMHESEVSYILWHKRLGHISKERVLQLSKTNLIPSLDFKNAEQCVDCMKGKLTNVRKFESKRSQNLLEIVHTDVCGPFPVKTICGN